MKFSVFVAVLQVNDLIGNDATLLLIAVSFPPSSPFEPFRIGSTSRTLP
jgi:hypothetical protein